MTAVHADCKLPIFVTRWVPGNRNFGAATTFDGFASMLPDELQKELNGIDPAGACTVLNYS